MKILIVTHTTYPEHIGGKEKYVLRLAEEWSQHHQVGIVCYSKMSERSFPWHMSPVLVKFHRVRWLPKPLPISQIMLVLTTIFVKLLFGYEVIYVNSSTAPELAGFITKVLTGTPYVMAVHNPCELVSTYLKSLSRKVKKLILKNASEVVAISKEIGALLVQQGFAPKEKIHFIPPGVEQEFFRFPRNPRIRVTKAEKEAATSIVITARRLVKEKGIDVLLRAIKILLDDGFLVDCIIVGKGPEMECLIHLSDKLGIRQHVKFTGFISDRKLRALISSASCYVIPSWREGIPIALFESMAIGTPVVATSVGGIPDVLPKELLVKPGDSIDLATKIEMVLSNRRFATRVSENNRKIAERHSWGNISARLLTVLCRTSTHPLQDPKN